ncbi:hypothetical protein PHMEG_00019532 [Phytophthora megakarya]|uniref:Uncharacterized protein n=1 Tax=Phytophthora megakarya TaxID=4795 RepID=A0A225VRD2_9STRA|nr:hypothetical protein PHMEG_00019532 [Phytophthora megakarya]
MVLLRAGYGGLENLVEVEHLSDQDRADLSKLLSEDQDIQRELLVPRDASVEPSPSDFRDMITGIPAQRELAALLRVYDPQGLARKVFGMSTLLKRMLDRHRVSQVACTLGTSKTTVAEILEQAQSWLSESDRDFQRAPEEHGRQERVLRDENADLQRQLEDYRLANRQLEDRLRGGTFKVGRVMNFLNRHNARVSGNWPRLKALLEKFKDGSLPPDAWKTQIQINATDEFDAGPGAYEYEVESDDEQSEVPDVPKSQVALKISTVDLTGMSSTESTPAKIQRKLFSGSKPKARTDFQLRPSVYAPSMTDTLDPTTAKQLSVTKALHIIYWKRLDRTPWAKYVPSWCYKEAEFKLAKALTSGEVPIRWPNLRKGIQDDAVEIMAALYDSVTEEEDDEGRDTTFSPGDDSQGKPQRRTTTPRQAKRGPDTTLDSSSKNKPKSASSPPKKRAKLGNGKKSRPGQERKQTALARKSYGSLSDSEKWIVDVPGQGILSWCHHGALMKFPPGTANAITQAFGFSDYAPNLAKDEAVQALRERWDPVAFKELMDTKPWDVMFEDRSKFLILHVRDNLMVVARESLDAIMAFMSVQRRAIWWFGHWVFIDLETDDPYSVELHRERKAECDKAMKEYKKLLDDRVDAGLEETILDEPGSWTIPDDGTRYTLNEQMELLDDQDPARVQWNTCASDEDRIKHLPEDYPLKLLKGSQRSSRKNRVTMDFD